MRQTTDDKLITNAIFDLKLPEYNDKYFLDIFGLLVRFCTKLYITILKWTYVSKGNSNTTNTPSS